MRQVLDLLRSIDRFLILLIAVVVAASVLPARGVAATIAEACADIGITLLFFLHGAKLSRAAILQGAGKWRLHLLVLGSTYVLFPLVGLALVTAAAGAGKASLLVGLTFLTLLPSTVQSSIAFTAIARGDVAAAICSASLSNVLGIVLTPLLVSLFMHVGGQGGVSPWHSVQTIVMQLLVPFVAGHLMRPLVGPFIDRHKPLVNKVDRGSILLVVYAAFSAAVVGGIWRQVDLADIAELLVISAVLLAAIMGINAVIARLAGLPREDAIVLLFCGSKKSLASGVPMAGALFPSSQVGMIVLPLMIFHQLQLFACAALASRFRREAEALDTAAAKRAAESAAVPRSDAEMAAAAAAIGLTIPEPCQPGVAANLALLASHAERLAAAPAPAP